MAAAKNGNPPKSIALLPVLNHTKFHELGKIFRIDLFSHLAVLPYQDIELSKVDIRLKDNGLLENVGFTQIPIQELGRILGCDAVVIGELNKCHRLFLGVYSQMTVEGCVTIWDTRSGAQIWTDTLVLRKHEGGIPLGLLDLPLISVRSGMNLRNTIREDLVDKLSENLISRIPAPPSTNMTRNEKFEYAYELQIGAYLIKENAYKEKKQLEEQGYYPVHVRSHWDERGLWHKVLIGSYKDREYVLQLQKEIRDNMGAHPVIARFVLNNNDQY
ncbi:MAG: SPOR domain-containing protein [Desulfobacterales bacterium]